MTAAPTVQRVAAYLAERARRTTLNSDVIAVLDVPGGRARLLVNDLHDLVRRALLLESLDAEVDRLGEIIREQRVELGKRDDVIEGVGRGWAVERERLAMVLAELESLQGALDG
jgi:hypothetical protein